MALNRNEKVGVFVGVAVAFGFILMSGGYFGNSIVSLGNSTNTSANGTTAEGLVIADLTEGNGAVALPGNILSVHYTGSLQDGTVFDSSVQRGTPYTFTLGKGEVIKGWDQGLAGMKVGGKRLLTIPPDLAYGSQAIGPVPANATLIFEVELLSIEAPLNQ
jgi:FKBP-type peptidyl-prolyl cis-trans isomerase